jgi:acetyl-CoA C-acetyltransferase
VFDSDEYIKPGSTLEALAGLRPAFAKDGTVTAGNASGLNDGAAAVIMMSAAQSQGTGPAGAGTHQGLRLVRPGPGLMGMGPVSASRCA